MYNFNNSHPTLTNLTFAGNLAGSGGGMANESNSSPTLTNVTFSGNLADVGGGMANKSNSSPTLLNVIFSGNSSSDLGQGGGMANESGSNPALTNVTFFQNWAYDGGGMYNGGSSPTLTNVTFEGNSTTSPGGGIYNSSNSSPSLINVTFTGNSASIGGGMANSDGSNPTLTNVTFADNYALSQGGGMHNSFSSNPIIRNTIFWTNTAAVDGDAIDNNSSFPVLTNTLIQDGCPSGATCNSVLLTTDPMFVRNPDSGDGDWTTLDDNDYGDLRLQAGSPAINQGNNSFVSAATDMNGNTRIIDGFVDLGAYETFLGFYVDDTANGDNNGSSWEHAYNDLQSALAASSSGYEIWVATGVYTPGNARTDSFGLVAGVETYGGFDPASGIDLFSERDWEVYPTVLSGDIDGNDGKDANGVVTDTINISGSNSYHVITSTNALSTTVLDGFIITAGNADGTFPDEKGGGMFNDSSSPALANLIFSGNSATNNGGGMYNTFQSSPILTNVTFSGNSATYHGAGMYNNQSSPILTNVIFSGNSTVSGSGRGGGMYNNVNSNPILTQVSFFANSANDGGGMYNNLQSSPSLTNVTFSGNSATYGAGMYNKQSSPILTNVIFSGNSTVSGSGRGGGMYNNVNSNPTLTNVTFAGNYSNQRGSAMTNIDSSPAIRNTIFWINTSYVVGNSIHNSGSSPVFTNTLIQGGCPSATTCNGTLLTSDPLFVRNPDAGDGNWSTLADNDYGDLRLQNSSPAINQGDNSYVSAATDLAGTPRILNDIVDLGAFETTYLYYVDHAAGGTATGLDWTNAYTNVQDALAAAASSDTIFVATGVYTPGTARTDTFALVGGVETYGGFDPASGIDLFSERDWETYPTVLSGDIDNNDTKDTNGIVTHTTNITGNNSHHVVTSSGVSTTAVLDGFTITAGQANGNYPNDLGGGIYNFNGSPSLSNIVFYGNLAGVGGGMNNEYNSNPILTQVSFFANSATYGGGMSNVNNGNAILTQVSFFGNSATAYGGGMYNNFYSYPFLTNDIFSGNWATNGGGGNV